jgi:hypothetical protein
MQSKMIENDANWDFWRFKSPEVCQFLIKMGILGGTSGKKHPQRTARVSGGDHRSPLFHLFIHAATIDRRHISSQSQTGETYALWRRSRRSALRPPSVMTVGSGTAVSVTNFE